MKPMITFENLRRLIGGRRKNKDRNESPFKRSESFKRISIRRNYLENRGGGGGAGGCQKGRNPTKRLPPQDDPIKPIAVAGSSRPASPRPTSPRPVVTAAGAPDDNVPTAAIVPRPPPPLPSPPPPPPLPPQTPPPTTAAGEQKPRTITPPTAVAPPAAVAPPVIDYGEWIRCIRAEEEDHLNNVQRSRSPPTPPARYRYHVHRELDDSSRTDSAISLGGRIWMDSPMLPPAAPRSLELPGRPAGAMAAVASTAADADGAGGGCGGQQRRRAHHSLESALKDKRDDRPVPCRRFHRYPVPEDKTSASRSSVASTCSGKDSGFSLSAPGLSDPPRPVKQLFRKKASKKPATSAAAPTNNAAKAASKCALPSAAAQDQLYQVVVARSPLRQLKLDPMMFVPPEKRRTAVAEHHHHHRHHHHHHHHHHPKSRPAPVEVHWDYCVPKDARQQRGLHDVYNSGNDDDDDDEQDRLYESISKARGVGCSRWQESTDDADTEEDDDDPYRRRAAVAVVPPAHVAAKKNRVKRKKSARRNIKYVVKPVRRAPSVVTRKPSVASKSKSAWITSTSTPPPPPSPPVYHSGCGWGICSRLTLYRGCCGGYTLVLLRTHLSTG